MYSTPCNNCRQTVISRYQTPYCPECGRIATYRRPRWLAHAAPIVIVAVLVVLNTVLLIVAMQDLTWSAPGIAIVTAPISNGVVLLLSLLALPVAKRLLRPPSLTPHVLTAIAGPLGFAVLDFTLIGSLRLAA